MPNGYHWHWPDSGPHGGHALGQGASLFGMVFGVLGAVMPEGNTAKAALLVAAGSLVTAIGNQFFQNFRLWLEHRRATGQIQYDMTVLKTSLDGSREHIKVLEANSAKDLERIAFLERMVEKNAQRLTTVEDSQVMRAVRPEDLDEGQKAS